MTIQYGGRVAVGMPAGREVREVRRRWWSVHVAANILWTIVSTCVAPYWCRPVNTAPGAIDLVRDVSGSVEEYDPAMRQASTVLAEGLLVGDCARLWALGPDPQLLFERRITNQADIEAFRSVAAGVQLSRRAHTDLCETLALAIRRPVPSGLARWVVLLSDGAPDPPAGSTAQLPELPDGHVVSLFFDDTREATVWGQLSRTGASLEVYSPAESLAAADRLAGRLQQRLWRRPLWPLACTWLFGLLLPWLGRLVREVRASADTSDDGRPRLLVEVQAGDTRRSYCVDWARMGREVTLGAGSAYEVDIPELGRHKLSVTVAGRDALAVRYSSRAQLLVDGKPARRGQPARARPGDVVALSPTGPFLTFQLTRTRAEGEDRHAERERTCDVVDLGRHDRARGERRAPAVAPTARPNGRR